MYVPGHKKGDAAEKHPLSLIFDWLPYRSDFIY